MSQDIGVTDVVGHDTCSYRWQVEVTVIMGFGRACGR
jgi:hypothetical protein